MGRLVDDVDYLNLKILRTRGVVNAWQFVHRTALKIALRDDRVEEEEVEHHHVMHEI